MEDQDGNRPIGAGGGRRRGPRGPKVANPLNNPYRARNEPQQQQAVEARNEPQEPQREFSGIYQIFRDWRLIDGLLGEIIEQKEAICWAIVLARLLEAAHNLAHRESSLFLQISIDDLVSKIKKKEEDKEITTLKRVLKVIAVKGIAKVPTTAHANPNMVKHIKWEFDTEEAADRDLIATKLEICPVGIIIDIDEEFDYLRDGFYKIRVVPQRKGVIGQHSLMVMARGRTTDGQEFFITQNSWSRTWGVNGYGRIIIDDDTRCTAFWPLLP